MIARMENHKGREGTKARRYDTVNADLVSAELNALSHRVIGAAIAVHRALGPGFAEQTYAKAMCIELEYCGMRFECESPVELTYREVVIGTGYIDLLVEGQLVVELKAVDVPSRQFRRQVAAYLKASGLTLGLLINFGADPLKDGIVRVINT